MAMGTYRRPCASWRTPLRVLSSFNGRQSVTENSCNNRVIPKTKINLQELSNNEMKMTHLALLYLCSRWSPSPYSMVHERIVTCQSYCGGCLVLLRTHSSLSICFSCFVGNSSPACPIYLYRTRELRKICTSGRQVQHEMSGISESGNGIFTLTGPH